MKNANDVDRLIEENGEPFILNKNEPSKEQDKLLRPKLINPATVEKKEIEYFWENKIPRGAISVLAGMQGKGKTFVSTYLTAHATTGNDWADGTKCPKGSVLFFYGEEDIARVYRSRLEAQGAILDRIRFLDGMEILKGGKVTGEKDVSIKNVEYIRQAIEDTKKQTGFPVVLVVIDPISNYWGGIKENDNAEVRGGLKPIQRLAEETEAVFLLIHHTGKTTRENSVHQLLGATALSAVARTVWMLYEDPDDPQNRIVAPSKWNYLVEPTSFSFFIDRRQNGKVIVLDTNIEKTADDFNTEMREAAFQNRTGRKPKKLSEAENWLREFLSGGRKPSGNPSDPQPGTVRYESDQVGHAWRTIERAKKSLGVKHFKDCGVTFWSLPPDLSILTERLRQNGNQENPLHQNSFSAPDSMESQALVNGGETKGIRQNASIYGNPGGVEQSDSLELTELNNVLNSNNQETDEKNTNSVFCSDPVPLPRMSPKKKSAQESSIMPPSLGKEEPKHEQASLFD